MRIRRATFALTLALGVLAASAPAATLAAGSVRMVDDDGKAAPGNCGASTSAKSTIQSAVNAAHDGDTIIVCPGTYAEDVTIVDFKDLTLKSSTKWGATIVPPSGTGPYYLVGIGDSKRVTVQNFKLSSPTTGDCGPVYTGFLVQGATDVIIRGNQVRAGGDKTLGECGYLTGVTIGNEGIAAAGARMADVSGKTSASVIFNSIRDFQFVGVAVVGDDTQANVRRNSIRYYHTRLPKGYDCSTPAAAGPAALGLRSEIRDLVQALPEQDTRISGVVVPPVPLTCFALGIVTGDGAGAVITGNNVHAGPGADPTWIPITADADQTSPILLAGIADIFSGGGRTLRIEDNRVWNSLVGVALLATEKVVVRDNEITSTGLGMYLDTVRLSKVKDNVIQKNVMGIGMLDLLLHLADSYANRFVDNDVRKNLEESCVDLTDDANESFPGTRGTDNLWQGNKAPVDSSDPVGICGKVGK